MAKNKNLIGSWSFLIGVILAIILGIAAEISTGWIVVLVIIGIAVGLLNIADEEVEPFLLSGAVLIIASVFGQNIFGTVPMLNRVLHALLALFVPATVIVAIKNVFTIARK